jgi:hypothetical protein
MIQRGFSSFLTVVVLLTCMRDTVAAPPGKQTPAVDFNRDIRPILSDKCFRCHGPDGGQRKGDLRLDQRDAAIADRQGYAAIVPGKPDESELYFRITAEDADTRMPPRSSGKTLKTQEVDLVKRWIEQGADYKPHWAFIPPRSQRLPTVQHREWVGNPIDAFVLAELERRGLKPSPEASKEILLRRVTLDLTGLPPTRQELEAFLADSSSDAYEKVVDRLLRSPRYGERMALDWLDAARYADTHGFFTDNERSAWPWRDWVIQAFNTNQPFDRFTIDQLAGDLLPHPTLAQRIATGFNRNHMVTDETGVIEEEYRVSYVVDRVDTLATVWLGLTMGCARCHDHKYDPISQKDYYSVFACFNNVPEEGLIHDKTGHPAPSLVLPTDEQERQLSRASVARKQCEAQMKSIEPELASALADWEKTALKTIPPLPGAGVLTYLDLDQNTDDHGPIGVETQEVGSLKFNSGVKGSALEVDVKPSIEFEEPSTLDRTSPFTISFWYKITGSNSQYLLTKIGTSADGRGLEIVWHKNKPRVNLVHRAAEDTIEVMARPLDQRKRAGNGWRHMAVTYDGSGKAAGVQIYLDGEPQPMIVQRDTLNGSIANEEPWRIGSKPTGVGLTGLIDEFRLYDRCLQPEEVEAIHWRDLLEGALEVPLAERSEAQKGILRDYYLEHSAPQKFRDLAHQLSEARTEEESARKAIVGLSVMGEMSKPRDAFVLVRGQYDQHGTKVSPGVPAALGKLPPGAPANRLGLATWLTDPSHPLTSRVTVNRYWQLVFGEGLVRTVNDFGLQGDLPSHPQLLDWLAVHFVESGWDVKGLMKLMVMSATYRQSSNNSPELLARDPENRLLAHAPRYRLPAEVIRDQALAIGGLLVDHLGGPSVKPYQPPGIWEAVTYDGDLSYEQDHGSSLYRRSLYTYWKRQSPPPALLIFDGPTRETCTVKRARTNTPLQALVLLNDPTYIEAARGLADRMLREGGKAIQDRIGIGFEAATGRRPSSKERETLTKFYRNQLKLYGERPDQARSLLHCGEIRADQTTPPAELAAWTMTASVLLNLDETITRH